MCGISSLGIDHTQILGDTIEKIAWQKGGIFKVCWLTKYFSYILQFMLCGETLKSYKIKLHSIFLRHLTSC